MTENKQFGINKLESYFNKIILKLRYIQKKHTLVSNVQYTLKIRVYLYSMRIDILLI